MSFVSLSSIQSSNGASQFTGNITWEIENNIATVYLRTWITAGYTYATIDGTLTVNGATLATGQWGTIYSSQLSEGEIAVVCIGSLPLDPGSSVIVEGYATISNSGSFSGTISGSGYIYAEAGEPDINPSPITLDASTVQAGSKLLITIFPENEECYHDLLYTFGGKTTMIAENVRTSYIWTVPDLLTSADSGTCIITCQTIYALQYIGETSASVTITKIKPVEPSQVSLISSSIQIGKNLMISIKPQESECLHNLYYSSGETKILLAEEVRTSYTWTVPDLTDHFPNATFADFHIICETYYESHYIGETSVSVTVEVPDPTVPSLNGNEATLGRICTIICKRSLSKFALKLELIFYESTMTIGDGTQDSFSWTPPYDLAIQIPNLISGTGTLRCTTFHGSAVVGVKEQTIRLIVPENNETKPQFTLSELTLAPTGNLPESFTGVYMRGKTGLKCDFLASSRYSTITDYKISIGSQKAAGNPSIIDILINEGDVNVVATVTDARGFSTTVNTSIHIIPYRNPKVTPFTGYDTVICERAESNGALSTHGTNLAIRAGRTFSSVILNGQERNQCILRYRWKTNGADNFSNWSTLIPKGSSQTELSILISNVVTSLQTSYVVQLEAADELGGSHILTFQIMTEDVSFVLFDGPDGAGFGKYPEAAHVVDIASHMTLRVRGKLVVDGSIWQDLGTASSVSEAVYPYGKKEFSGCHMQVNDGNHVYLAFDCAFIYSGMSVVLNQNPIPVEHRPKRTSFALCPVNGRAMALVSAGTDGYIRLEWIQELTDTTYTSSYAVEWLDGYLDYWT